MNLAAERLSPWNSFFVIPVVSDIIILFSVGSVGTVAHDFVSTSITAIKVVNARRRYFSSHE